MKLHNISVTLLVVLTAILFLTAADCARADADAEPTERLEALMALDRPLVIAHRGYSMAAPENTLPAFRLALWAHSDLVELDYFHSSDGIPVVFHDRTLDRTTNSVELWGKEDVPIASKPYRALRELDAGTWFSEDFAGAHVPTLAEALDVIQSESITLIERKQGDAQTLFELLVEKNMLDDVVVQAFDWDFLADFHDLAPNVPLGALGPPRQADGSRYPRDERYLDTGFLDRLEAAGASVVGWNRQVTPESVKQAQDRGLPVWVYTINEPDEARRLLDMGVDGIITDNPAMLWKVLALREDSTE